MTYNKLDGPWQQWQTSYWMGFRCHVGSYHCILKHVLVKPHNGRNFSQVEDASVGGEWNSEVNTSHGRQTNLILNQVFSFLLYFSPFACVRVSNAAAWTATSFFWMFAVLESFSNVDLLDTETASDRGTCLKWERVKCCGHDHQREHRSSRDNKGGTWKMQQRIQRDTAFLLLCTAHEERESYY